jgi:hypothetical protein
MGDIALDDVDIAVGNCPTPKYCDFEGNMCGWKNVKVRNTLHRITRQRFFNLITGCYIFILREINLIGQETMVEHHRLQLVHLQITPQERKTVRIDNF